MCRRNFDMLINEKLAKPNLQSQIITLCFCIVNAFSGRYLAVKKKVFCAKDLKKAQVMNYSFSSS